MRKVVSTENMSDEEWLKWRKKGIGGSDAAIILGISPFKSILELWHEKLENAVKTEEETEAAYWGTKLEPVVKDEFTTRTGLSIYTEPFLLRHSHYSFMQANLDGIIYDPVYGNCVFEAKTASAYKSSDWEEGIPDEYYAQVQHYMAVTGYRGTYIAALIGGNQFIWKFVERDAAYIKKLIQKEKEFWSYVTEKTMPPLDGAKVTAEFLKGQYAWADEKEVLNLPDDAWQWIELFRDAKAKEDAAVIQKELAKNQLKALLQNHEKAVLRDVVVSWSNVVTEEFDVKELRRDEPEVYKSYVYESRYRRFTINPRKAGKADGKTNEHARCDQ